MYFRYICNMNNAKQNIRQPKMISAVQQMLKDKKAIESHIQNGGKLDDIKIKGIRFAKPL